MIIIPSFQQHPEILVRDTNEMIICSCLLQTTSESTEVMSRLISGQIKVRFLIFSYQLPVLFLMLSMVLGSWNCGGISYFHSLNSTPISPCA
jgi:hypothetical protein